MSKPYTKRITIQYHETAYYDASGEEVGRVRHYDDAEWDADSAVEITEEELEENTGWSE